MSTHTTPAVSLLERYVRDGSVPGGVIAVGQDPEPVAVGEMSIDGSPLRTDAIFRIMSMTKLITAVAALRLVERGALDLDSEIARWLPELAEPRVLTRPDAELDDTETARAPITLHHLLTNTSGYGMILDDSPLHRAMVANGTEAGPRPPSLGATDWLEALSALPLVAQPGEAWRYHHSFGLLGILLSRISGRATGDHLSSDLFTPLGMTDTGYFVPEEKRERLPAAYAEADGELVEREPAGGGFHVGPPPYDLSHSELLSTAADYLTFLRALCDGRLISAEHLRMLRRDQVPGRAKHPGSFFPGFWEQTGWGYGVGVMTDGPHRGRFGWSGGLSTDFFVDPDGTVGLVLTQVERGPRTEPLLERYLELTDPSASP